MVGNCKINKNGGLPRAFFFLQLVQNENEKMRWIRIVTAEQRKNLLNFLILYYSQAQ